MMHLEIAVAAPLDGVLTYRLTEECGGGNAPEVVVGRRVLVPLGSRKVTGYILGVVPEPEKQEFKIRSVISFLDPYPLFHPEIIAFFIWVADYYHYPLGMVIKAALPGGLSTKSVKRVVLKASSEELYLSFKGDLPDWAKKIGDDGELGFGATGRLLASSKTSGKLKQLEKKEIVSIITDIQKDTVSEKKELCYAICETTLVQNRDFSNEDKENITTFRDEVNKLNSMELSFSAAKSLFYLAKITFSTQNRFTALKDIRKYYPAASKGLELLTDNGLVTKSFERVFRNPFGEQLRYCPPPDKLTDDQAAVLSQIYPVLRKKEFGTFLLHGVTGCGKTEVYLQAAEEALRLGRDVLVLVPEIGLATALEAHFLSRFSDLVVLQHSGMTKAERFDQYFLALTGKAKVVIGARSALFAPLRNPGLIVVDEEHDQGFKQDDSFRYNARDLAVLRGKFQKSVVLLGSATPSITSYANSRSGKYTLLEMKKRVGKSVLPTVTLVDLNSEDSKKEKAIIKKGLRAKLETTISSGKQAILLLNRRGFSGAVICRECGTPLQCNHCHVSLTFHKGKKRLICHYCGFSLTEKSICGECHSADLAPVGIGTERVEEEILEFFPEARVRRLDSDSAADRKKFHRILNEMHEGEIDILIGTQMIAKGHHFPLVTLVGVVWADGGMSMPDFRASERTFQLITQVTGRAGRGDFPGDVIIQTMRPEHYSISYARDHKYLQLFDYEMKIRRCPAFPPYVRLAVVHVKGTAENQVQKTALMIAKFCRSNASKNKINIEVLGPAPSPLDKIKDNYRWQVLIKGAGSSDIHRICSDLKMDQRTLVQGHCSFVIDVDPESLM